MLRWLVMTRCYNLLDQVPPCDLVAVNARLELLTQDDVERMEQEAATRVHSSEQHASYLSFAAFFFRWWAKVAEVCSTPQLPTRALDTCEWLTDKDVDRSLVVPDVRRAALKLVQRMELRPGECQLVAELTGGKKSITATCQAMRTGERCNLVHNTIMYGTLSDIYHSKMLDVIYFAIINGRYLGRLNFDFIDNVLMLPCMDDLYCKHSWPLIYVHGKNYVVAYNKKHTVCHNARDAYACWHACCLLQGGVIGGYYDVRKCTI